MSDCKLQVIGNRILVKERVFEEKTKGGIQLPQESLEKYQNMETEGELRAMGLLAFENFEANERPKLGNIVYFQKYDGIGKKYNGVNYRILTDEDIFAVSDRYIAPEEDLYA